MKKATKISIHILYYLLIIFISYTLMNKVLITDSFLLNIAKTGLFSDTLVYIVGYLAMIAEFAIIILLIFKRNVGLRFAFCMMTVFSLYILYLFLSDRYEICGCGGILNGMSFISHFAINILVILIITFLIKHSNAN